jgi:V8-like Glu-specific endopeptidase
MTHPFEAHYHSDPSLLYSLSKPVLGYIDRQSAVSSKTRLTFPDSAVGRIQFKEKIKNNSLNGTGFLISPTLVLTASHNFIRNVDNAIL